MRRTVSVIAAAATTAAALTMAGDAQADPKTEQGDTAGWSVAQINTLAGEDGISVLSVAPTGSTWAAGYQASGSNSVPLVQHLVNGKWSTIKSPSSSLGRVSALSASSSKNVWAFGSTDSGTFGARWNGSAWKRTTLTTSRYFPQDAIALSASNVWVVGGDQTKSSMHWNGSSWKKIALPGTARAIAGVSSTHVYAAGTYKNQPAVMYWTGSAWKVAKTPKLTPPTQDASAVLNDIYAPSASNVWAAGGWEWECGEDGDDTCTQAYLLHWNGKKWSKTIFDQVSYASFTQVTGDGAGGLWLLRGGWDPVLKHLVRGKATDETAPRPSGHDINLTDLAVHGTTVWAGGTAFPEGDPDDPTGNGLYLRTG